MPKHVLFNSLVYCLSCFDSGYCRPFRVNAYEFAFAALVFKFYKALDQCKKRIVFAAADILAGFPFCAALTSQNISTEDMLAAALFEAEPLRMRIASVS